MLIDLLKKSSPSDGERAALINAVTDDDIRLIARSFTHRNTFVLKGDE